MKKKNLLLNFERTQKICHQINEFFDGGECQTGLLGAINGLRSIFIKNKDIFHDQIDRLSIIEDYFEAIKKEVDEKTKEELEPEEIDLVLEKLDLYQRLKKKFGGSIQSILATQEEFLHEQKRLKDLALNLETFDERISSLEKRLNSLSNRLHVSRVKHAVKLSEELTHRVRLLKMNGATIRLSLEEIDDFTEFGKSKVSLTAETNPGEGFFRVKDIASGGELSRVLLALRQSLSSVDSISIFLFDEIDTGIGGETGTSIGKALLEVATHGQVVAITHLPQIARFASNLIVVNKDVFESEHEPRTESRVKELRGKDVLKQVRAMAQLE